MDLSLSADERAFALEVRTWLDHDVDRPDPALSGEEAIDWGRRWQAGPADARMVAVCTRSTSTS